MTRQSVEIASLPSRLIAAVHNLTGQPGGSVMPPTLTKSVVTRAAIGAAAARAAGANYYLIKPVGEDALLEHVALLCGRRA